MERQERTNVDPSTRAHLRSRFARDDSVVSMKHSAIDSQIAHRMMPTAPPRTIMIQGFRPFKPVRATEHSGLNGGAGESQPRVPGETPAPPVFTPRSGLLGAVWKGNRPPAVASLRLFAPRSFPFQPKNLALLRNWVIEKFN